MKQSLAGLIDRWVADPTFRSEVRKDPEKAVQRAGVVLSESERQQLRTMVSNHNDEELLARARTGGG